MLGLQQQCGNEIPGRNNMKDTKGRWESKNSKVLMLLKKRVDVLIHFRH